MAASAAISLHCRQCSCTGKLTENTQTHRPFRHVRENESANLHNQQDKFQSGSVVTKFFTNLWNTVVDGKQEYLLINIYIIGCS